MESGLVPDTHGVRQPIGVGTSGGPNRVTQRLTEEKIAGNRLNGNKFIAMRLLELLSQLAFVERLGAAHQII